MYPSLSVSSRKPPIRPIVPLSHQTNQSINHLKLNVMALNFTLVERPDMRKDAAEGSKLFYAQVRSLKRVPFEKLCDMIALRSTAFPGDVMLVIEGLLSILQERLEEGDIVQVGRLGNFRMVAGSKGAATKQDFTTELFKTARVIFSPGTMLNDIRKSAKFEKITTKEEKETGKDPSDKPDSI